MSDHLRCIILLVISRNYTDRLIIRFYYAHFSKCTYLAFSFDDYYASRLELFEGGSLAAGAYALSDANFAFKESYFIFRLLIFS